jgi:hypothetical protein
LHGRLISYINVKEEGGKYAACDTPALIGAIPDVDE